MSKIFAYYHFTFILMVRTKKAGVVRIIYDDGEVYEEYPLDSRGKHLTPMPSAKKSSKTISKSMSKVAVPAVQKLAQLLIAEINSKNMETENISIASPTEESKDRKYEVLYLFDAFEDSCGLSTEFQRFDKDEILDFPEPLSSVQQNDQWITGLTLEYL